MSDALGYTFDHVHVFASDVDATRRWFVDVFGATDAGMTPLGMPQLTVGGTRLLLRGERPSEGLTPTAPSRHFGTDHLGFTVRDLDATVAELTRRGVAFESAPMTPAPGVRIVFLRGPDDVRIELLQFG
jgi:catechol 2,3-dioxygenase-like lactoylglutathione lyase family enzyme